MDAQTFRTAPDCDDVQHMFGCIHEIRTEAQRIQAALSEVRKQADVVDLAVRAKQVADVLAQTTPFFAHPREAIIRCLEKVRPLLDQNAALHDEYGDALVKLENAWNDATLVWFQPSQSSDEVLRSVEKVDHYLCELIRQCGMIALPDRVNSHLRQLGVGQQLNFHQVFQADLPVPADRQEVLAYIAAHPKSIEGVVDVARGIIARTSPRKGRRVLSIVWMLLVPVVGLGLLFLARAVFPQGLPLSFDMYVLAYLALFAGGVVHLLVAAAKQARSGQGDPVLSDWILWLHTKEASLVMNGIYLWMGFIGLIVLKKVDDPLTAFFLGYSVDSVVDLFLERFNTAASSRVATLQATLSVPAGSDRSN